MPTKNYRIRRRGGRSIGEAISAVGWQRLLLWPAVAAVPVAVAANTFWLVIETLLPPSAARGAELVPYFGGIFLATVVGQILGPYAALRWELERLEPGYREWFGAKNPLAELNRILWNMGTEAQSNSFQSSITSRTDESAPGILDERRAKLLTAVSRNLESVPKLFHVPGVSRSDVAEFGSTPPDDSLISLARGLREAGWGQVELKPSWEWVVYTPSSVVGTLVLLVAMIVVLARMSGSGLVGTLAVQCPFYFAAIAFSMLPGADRRSGIVQAALPAGLRAVNLDESLALARDPFERIRLFLGALPPDDQKALLGATHYALWKAVRACRTRSKVRTAQRQPPASEI
jgi:hypothetical protein